MAKRIPTPEGAVLRFFRFSRGLSTAGLAVVLGASPDALKRRELSLKVPGAPRHPGGY